MKHSIRKQFALIFIGLMIGVIAIVMVINLLFLEQFYISNKTNVIIDVYDIIKTKTSNEEFNIPEFNDDMNTICYNYNISLYVMNSDSYTVFASENGGRSLEPTLARFIFVPNKLYGGYNRGKEAIRTVQANGISYIEMICVLDTGYSFIMRTPMESIRESVNISNRFFLYVGTIMIFLSGIVIWVITKKITRPILELTDISKRMIHLDFDAKYKGRTKNEFALLGENINKLSDSLEGTISELKTANNELKKDIEKKEAIDEMRKEFLSNVSHELKTPIALIQGYTEGLQVGVNDDEESKDFYCEVIMDEAAKMNNMVQRLMSLNQLEFGNDTVAMERFDIVKMIQTYVQSAQILTSQKNIEVRLQEYQPIFVWADEFKIEEIFANYFSNAINHCSGKKVIDVKLEEKDKKVRVTVFNTGEPIPEDAISHVWEKFYKVDKARTREYGGSGVGLSIVKAIAESMNLDYGVKNYTNGVLFWFELELVEEQI